MNDLSVIEKEFGDLSAYAQAPDFWVSKPERAMPFIQSLPNAARREIGRSAGGRPILAIEYGEKEPLDATTDNLPSAIASTVSDPDPTAIFPESFFGTRRRRRPVVAFQGAIHGGELTGTAASLNLCRIIETGADLRGKPWPRLAELARGSRILVIPWANPDGTARWPLHNPSNAPTELLSRLTTGVDANGEPYRYPHHKNIFPIPPDQTSYMGSYFNDNGVNLQYDIFTLERQPETLAWMRYYLDERPDGVTIWHCNAGSMISSPEPFLPVGYQHEVSRLGGAVRSRLLREGYKIGRLSWSGLVGMGTEFMNQMNAVYHVSGACPIVCELPAGYALAPFSCDELLDVGLITIEEILEYAHSDGLRPYETWDKVKKRLAREDAASA